MTRRSRKRKRVRSPDQTPTSILQKHSTSTWTQRLLLTRRWTPSRHREKPKARQRRQADWIIEPEPIIGHSRILGVFQDGTEVIYTTNLIAECLYSQIDDHGRRLQVMKEIVDHDKGRDALIDEDAYYSTKAGPNPKRTTRGWRLLVEWKNGSSSWVPLIDMKDSYPDQVADHVVLNNLTQELAFRWWVPFILKKRERILKKIKSKYWSTLHIWFGTSEKCRARIRDRQENGDGHLEEGNWKRNLQRFPSIWVLQERWRESLWQADIGQSWNYCRNWEVNS